MALRYVLPNGLTVVFEEQHAAKVAAFQVWVKVGSADERPDQAGLAHLHEHMLFKGTARRAPGEIARDVEAHGGEINAWTSFDQTVYHIVMASQFAREGLDILGDAIRHSAFDAGELAKEIEVVCEEIKRGQDVPSRRASRDLFATSYQTHPYRLPVIGTEESVRSFTREKVLEFYQRHYTPKNLVLCAAGDVDEKSFRTWVDEIFGGDWGRPELGPVARPQEPAASARKLLIRPDDAKEAYLNLGFPIPEAEHEDVPALDVLAMLLGQGESSRLHLQVKRKLSLVNDIHAYAYTPQDPGLFTVSLTLPPQHLEQALEETVRVVASFKAQPVPEAELATVKALIESDAVYQRETVQGVARKLGYYQSSLGGLEAEGRYYEQVARLTPERIRATAEKYLRFEHFILTGLVPPSRPFTAEQAEACIDGALKQSPTPPTERKTSRGGAANDQPLRLTPRAAAKGAGKIVEERLSSGARILVREERAVPLVAIRAAFAGGLRYETPEDNGITTLLSRGLTRGTPTHDAEQLNHLVDELSGALGGQGGRNSVGLRGEFLSKHFRPAFELFSEVLLTPTFPEEEISRERTLQLQDIHTREDKPSGLAFELFNKTLFDAHPYRMPVLGEQASVEKLNAAALHAYHRAHLNPSQLTLAVVGDVQVEEVLALAEASWGQSRHPAQQAAPKPAREAGPSGPREAKVVLPRAQTHLVLGFPGLTLDNPERHALSVLSTLLSGQGGRLFIELRDKRSMAYSVSSFALEGVDPGYFGVYMGTSPEKVDAALEGIRNELRRVREDVIPEAEVEHAKQNLIGTHEIGLQRNGARAGLLALDGCYGLGQENFLHYAERVSAVTASHVRDVAQRIIDFNKSALAIVGP